MTRKNAPRNHLVRYEKGEIDETLIDVAKSRIQVHLHNMRMADYDLERILTNVYLQGCRDMAESIVNQQLKAEL